MNIPVTFIIYTDMHFCPEHIITPNSKCPVLIPNLCNKFNYIIRYKALKQCLRNGLRLTIIWKVFKFNQLQSYINLNSRLRGVVKLKFKKDLMKLTQ